MGVLASDIAVLALAVLSFATWVTVHVAIAARLALHGRPRWRGAVVLVFPPLGPFWAIRAGYPKSAALWIFAMVAFASAQALARI